MTLAGVGLRMARVPSYGVIGGQVVTALLGLNLLSAAQQSFLWRGPDARVGRRTWFEVVNGGATLNQYSSPVQINPHSTAAMLTVCGLGVILAVDALTLEWRQAPLAALPLLAALSVPVSILREGLALPVFVVTALLFLRLVASDHLSTFGGWGRTTRRTPRRHPLHLLAGLRRGGGGGPDLPAAGAGQRPAATHRGSGEGSGGGGNAGFQLTTVNPFIRLRRDLVEKTHTPLVYADTKAPRRRTCARRCSTSSPATSGGPRRATCPATTTPAGSSPPRRVCRRASAVGPTTWKLSLDPNFSTAWLPLPYPVQSSRSRATAGASTPAPSTSPTSTARHRRR